MLRRLLKIANLITDVTNERKIDSFADYFSLAENSHVYPFAKVCKH